MPCDPTNVRRTPIDVVFLLLKNIFKSIFCLFIALPFYSSAQTAADKKVQAGLTFNAGANFLSPSSNKIEANGAGSIISVGLNLHSAFKSSPNIAIATGLEFDFGKNKFSIFRKYFSIDEFTSI